MKIRVPSRFASEQEYKEFLCREYCVNLRTIHSIAVELDEGDWLIHSHLKYFLIPRRSSDSYKISGSKLLAICNRELLHKLYCIEGKSVRSIAKEIGVQYRTILKYLQLNGVDRRQVNYTTDIKSKIDNKEYLQTEYVDNKKTAVQIASELGVHYSMVCDYLEKHSIKRRTSLDYGDVVSTPHKMLLIPLLERMGVAHETSYLVEHKGKHIYEMDEYLPNQKVFIELQGLYWHGYLKKNRCTARNVSKDIRKYQYIKKYWPDHRIIYLLESDFDNGIAESCIANCISSDRGTITWSSAGYDLRVGVSEDVRKFVKSNHYYGTIPPNKYVFSCMREGAIVAVATFSSPSRNEQRQKYGSDCIELSRYCSVEHRTNMGSWFLSRCIRLIKERPIITYADITRMPGKPGHDGTLYKACNFKLVGCTNKNYRYLKEDGTTLHKRAVWGRAKKNGVTEKTQALKEKLAVWYEWPKLIYIYDH